MEIEKERKKKWRDCNKRNRFRAFGGRLLLLLYQENILLIQPQQTRIVVVTISIVSTII